MNHSFPQAWIPPLGLIAVTVSMKTPVLKPQGEGSMVEKGLIQQRLWNALAA